MEEIFKPLSKTIRDVFDGNTYYQIPSYQRPYSWDTEKIEDLWNDINNALEDKDQEYFLGSIILTKSQQGNFDVIDGQQRLTTLTILFCLLRDLYYVTLEDSSKKNKILGRIKNLESGNERLRFKTQLHQQTSFEQEILNGMDFTKPRRKSEIEKDNFLNAAYFFKAKIEALKSQEPTKLEEFTDYLLDKTRVITIECSKQSFAIKLFQVLNNRGMELSPADLIKSFLMERLSEEDLLQFAQDWIQVENKAKDLEEDLTKLFTYYEYYLLASNPKKSLYEELERQFKNKNPKQVIHSFRKLTDYFDEIDSETSKTIYGLKYLQHDVYWKSILLTAKMESWETENFAKLSKLLLKMYYLYWVAEYTSTKIKQVSFNIISWIKSKKDIEQIKAEVEAKLKEDYVIGKAIRNLNGPIYAYGWGKPLLALIEYQQTDDSNTNFIDLDKFAHAEHILPQGYAKIEYWRKLFTSEEAETLVDTIGNLTLLSGKKNITASNKPFPDKIAVYTGKGIDGMTAYRMTQKIVDNLKGSKDWTKEKIAERKTWVLTELGRVLDVDLFQEIKEEIEEETEPAPTIETKEIYDELKKQVLMLGPEVKEEEKKYYIAFKKKQQNFLTLKVQQSKIKVWLSLEKEDIQENPLVPKDVSDIGHHGTGDLEIEIDSKEQIPALMELVEKAYAHTTQNQTEYKIENHINNIDNANIRKKVETLLSKIKEEFPTAEQYATKGWIVIKNNKQFVSIPCSKTKVWLNLSYPEGVFQSKFAFEDNVKEKRWKYIALTEDSNLDELMPFVKMAYERN